MQTDRIAVALRPREGWEAVDLGFRMVRTWWRPVFGAWLAVVLPTVVILHVLLYEHLWLVLLMLWWLEPVYDRVALFVLSEALLGRTPPVRRTLGELGRLLRSGVPSSLLWLRPSPLRALHLPVLQLEGLRGRVRVERTRRLAGRAISAAIGLHIACLLFELVVALGLLEFLSLFEPEWRGGVLWELTFLDGSWRGWLMLNGLYVAALCLVEPFYVGGGFGLYISRRVYLEGWDIDLVFRRIARRGDARETARSTLRTSGLATLLLVTLPFASVAAPGDPPAEDGEPAPITCADDPRDAAECIERLLDTPEFATTREVEYWWPRWSLEGGARTRRPPEFLIRIADVLAHAVRVGAWVGLALAILGLLYLVWRRTRGTPPAVEAGETPVGVGPPDDLVAAARERWTRGDRAGGLSLLYRGAVLHLGRTIGAELPEGATEGDCECIAQRRAPPALAVDFTRLARVWQLCAYADRPPAEVDFFALCACWAARLEVAS